MFVSCIASKNWFPTVCKVNSIPVLSFFNVSVIVDSNSFYMIFFFCTYWIVWGWSWGDIQHLRLPDHIDTKYSAVLSTRPDLPENTIIPPLANSQVILRTQLTYTRCKSFPFVISHFPFSIPTYRVTHNNNKKFVCIFRWATLSTFPGLAHSIFCLHHVNYLHRGYSQDFTPPAITMNRPGYHVSYLQVNPHHISLTHHLPTHYISLTYQLPHQVNNLEQMSCNPSIPWNICNLLCNQFVSNTIPKHQCWSMPLTSSQSTHKRNYQFMTNDHKWNPRNTSTLPLLRRKTLQSLRQISLQEPQFMGTLTTLSSQSDPYRHWPSCPGVRWVTGEMHSCGGGSRGWKVNLCLETVPKVGKRKIAPAVPVGCPPEASRQKSMICKDHLRPLPILQPPDPGSSS